MATLMERALELAARAGPVAAGGPILYQRGTHAVPIEATFGSSEFQRETAEGMLIERTDRDFIFPAERLLIDGDAVVPERGDRITIIEQGADGQVFEVLAPGGAQVYRLCDPQGYLIRVHTKRLTS